jgi:hypothetical protein
MTSGEATFQWPANTKSLKGGELRDYLEASLRQAGRSEDLVLVGPKDATFNFLGDNTGSDVKVANQLIAGPVYFRSS